MRVNETWCGAKRVVDMLRRSSKVVLSIGNFCNGRNALVSAFFSREATNHLWLQSTLKGSEEDTLNLLT